MPAPYSADWRERLIEGDEQGKRSPEAVAKRWWKRYQRQRRIAAERMGGGGNPKVEQAGG